MKFGKIQKNLDLCWKFGSKMRFFTKDLWRMKFGKIQKFSVGLKNFAWNQEFDHSWPAKDEILQNQEILIHVKKFSSKLTFLKAQDMRRIKFGKIQKFSNASNIWPKIETFDHSGPVKEEIWQHPEILSCFENLV